MFITSIFVNIVSLPKYLDELRLRMDSQTLDILALSETRLDNTFTDYAVSIEGYSLVRRDRCRSGGGVAIYIRNVIEYKIRSDLSDPDLEFLCIEIQKPKTKPFLLSNWYRPPNTSIELFDKFEVLLGKIEAENIESNILGDLNCDMMAISPANETKHLIELCESFQYAQLIKEPTRVTSSSKSLIDLFLTNEPDKFVTSGVSHIGCSDHSLIYVSRKLTCPRSFPRIIESRQYKNFVPDNFMNDIALVPWDIIEQIDNPTSAWEVWKQSFLAVANLHAPVKKRRVRNSKAPWLTPEIKRLMWERDRIKRIATVTNDQLKWAEYRRLKNRVNHSIKACKKDYYHSYFEDNVGKAKAIWNGINTVLSRKKNVAQASKLIIGDAEITDPYELSNAFNRHFTEIGPNLASYINPPRVSFRDFVESCGSTFELELLTIDELRKLVNDIPVGKADGLDGIPTCLLKLSFTLIASSLTHIFNLVISTGIIPKDWKSARVTPIFKADSKVDPANYRPISVLPVIGKLFEKAIFNQVYTYLNDNKLLSKYQSGFRPMHSTLTALIDITDNWYLNIDNGLTNAILFIDLKKAFDTIDHEILLSKLELYGFKGASLNLFRDFLSDRTQVTVINNVNSDISFIRCGVPQGSVLGPLLFLLYINDLPNCNLLSDVRMYADDTNLTFASKDPEELFSSLTHDLSNLKRWLDSNRLSLNVLKTKCLFTGTRHKISLLPSEPHICLDGHLIERVNSYKSLGVQVDETLSWEAHISEVVGKVAKVLAALRRLRPVCPQSTLVTIYKSLVLPHLDYCSAVWGCIGNGLSQKLEKLQNRAARIITGSGWDVRSAQILRALNWKSLADRRAKQLKSLMFKTVNNLVPEYLSDKFASVNTIHRHNLRGAQHNLFIPRPNTEALKKSFRYRGAVTWNSLSAEAKQATTLNSFYSAIV